MLERLSVKNFKSIADISVDLGRFNVFIGENGCGKSNILESIAMLGAAKSYALDIEELYGRGVRVARPSITFSSFIGKKRVSQIEVEAQFQNRTSMRHISKCSLSPEGPDDIFAKWIDHESSPAIDIHVPEDEKFQDIMGIIKTAINKEGFVKEEKNANNEKLFLAISELVKINSEQNRTTFLARNLVSQESRVLTEFVIYNLNTKALRGIQTESRKVPLGVNGEGLDVLIASFDTHEMKSLMERSYFVSWLSQIVPDHEDKLKLQGHKLGKSTSILYFKDRFMNRNNNIFSAENANEGVLHVLFYLCLFISKRTPSFFGIDNIETCLNPQLCRVLVKELCKIAKETNKQALVTTHNPAVLDGLNLNDPEQRLFVVSRSDAGDTKVRRIQFKKKIEPVKLDDNELKLSEMWTRGFLGGIPKNF